ncbi:MAG: hypothetical protein SR1Q7_04110 [Quinella sp. 1Q7]|nr:hypothetical protein [Quinella sp. 1Q7]MBR2734501.1 hypothetical protein [Selenomonadaceae bacterium]
MATTEERVDKLETRFTTLEQQVATVAAKVDMVIGEIQQQREDRRQFQEKHDADMREMREDVKGTLKHIQNLTIASMVGIGAIAIATWVFVLTGARNETPPPATPQAQYQMTQPAPINDTSK